MKDFHDLFVVVLPAMGSRTLVNLAASGAFTSPFALGFARHCGCRGGGGECRANPVVDMDLHTLVQLVP